MMKTGDKMRPVGAHLIYCSHHVYSFAIVQSVDPFVLVSEEGDMTWTQERPEDFKVCHG